MTAGPVKMKSRMGIVLGVLLAVASPQSLAFEEQTTGVAPSATPAPAAKTEQGPAAGLETAPPQAKPEGTEITIPGLGRLGVLPKMDFGLELLYGANESPKQPEGEPGVTAPLDDDLTIRGSIKKSF